MKISSLLFLFDFSHGKLDMGSEEGGSVTGSAKPQMNQKGKISQLIENEKDWEELQAKDVPLGTNISFKEDENARFEYFL